MPPQGDEPGVGGGEPATAEVERAKVVLEVHMQPFAPGRACLLHPDRDEPGSHPLAPRPCGDQRVEDERVHAAIPGHVEKADEVAPMEGADPAQAVLVHLSPPVIVEHPVTETLSVQPVDRGVVERTAPFVGDHLANLWRSQFERTRRGMSG